MSDETDRERIMLDLIERVDARAARLEEGFQLLTQLIQGHSGQLDTQRDWINQLGEAQAESEQKIAALADAQIRTEDALARFTASTEAALARLAQAQTHTDGRLDALIDIVRGLQGGQG